VGLVRHSLILALPTRAGARARPHIHVDANSEADIGLIVTDISGHLGNIGFGVEHHLAFSKAADRLTAGLRPLNRMT
jgi:hypothetical protein